VAAALAPGARGKDIDLVLIAADAAGGRARADPAFEAHSQPISAWTEAIWCKWFTCRSLNIAVSRAKLRLAKAARPWAAVHGPAAAVVATAARLGWAFIDATTIRMEDGTILDLRAESPRSVADYVRKAVEKWRWLRLEQRYPHLDSGGRGLGAEVTPILKMMHCDEAADGWGPPQRAALRSAFTRGQWPQARLAASGLATDPRCRFCLHEAGQAEASVAMEQMDVDIPCGNEFHRV
jgi:hypothetical protein